jgi:DNA repair exonuclease SbcCD ATPase subunit
MKTGWRWGLVVAIGLAGARGVVGGEGEKLEERVARLESVVGRQATATPWRPDMITRLSRLEEEVRGHARPGPEAPRQQSHARLARLEEQAAELNRRLQRIEGASEKPTPDTNVSRLQREVDQLERTVRQLSERLKRMERGSE